MDKEIVLTDISAEWFKIEGEESADIRLIRKSTVTRITLTNRDHVRIHFIGEKYSELKFDEVLKCGANDSIADGDELLAEVFKLTSNGLSA